MTAPVLSFPFRLLPAGALATVEQGTDEADAELIAMLVLTAQGEREMAPQYGIPPAPFGGLSAASVQAGVAAYGPNVAIDKIDVNYPDGGTEIVGITFH